MLRFWRWLKKASDEVAEPKWKLNFYKVMLSETQSENQRLYAELNNLKNKQSGASSVMPIVNMQNMSVQVMRGETLCVSLYEGDSLAASPTQIELRVTLDGRVQVFADTLKIKLINFSFWTPIEGVAASLEAQLDCYAGRVRNELQRVEGRFDEMMSMAPVTGAMVDKLMEICAGLEAIKTEGEDD